MHLNANIPLFIAKILSDFVKCHSVLLLDHSASYHVKNKKILK